MNNKKEAIHILCATDAKYAHRLSVTLISLFANNIHNKLYIHIFVSDKNLSVWQKYYEIAANYGKPDLEIIEVQKDLLLSCGAFESGYFTLAIYYRLFAPLLLPATINKVLYLDGDIIVTGDVSEIWNVDVTDNALAVCPDFAYFDEINNSLVRNASRSLSANNKYFNSGCLLMNLSYWRANDISTKCLQYLKEHTTEIRYMDQDVMNAVLTDNVAWMNWSYNFQVFCVEKRYFTKYSCDLQNQIRKCYKKPLIIHYLGPTKPWHIKYRGRQYANIWMHYQLRSPWPFDIGIGPGSIWKLFKFIVKRLLWLVGLKGTRGIYGEFAKDI